MYGINNLSTNSFTVLRDKTFLLMSAFGEGFVLINMEPKKGEMILTKKKLFWLYYFIWWTYYNNMPCSDERTIKIWKY